MTHIKPVRQVLFTFSFLMSTMCMNFALSKKMLTKNSEDESRLYYFDKTRGDSEDRYEANEDSKRYFIDDYNYYSNDDLIDDSNIYFINENSEDVHDEADADQDNGASIVSDVDFKSEFTYDISELQTDERESDSVIDFNSENEVLTYYDDKLDDESLLYRYNDFRKDAFNDFFQEKTSDDKSRNDESNYATWYDVDSNVNAEGDFYSNVQDDFEAGDKAAQFENCMKVDYTYKILQKKLCKVTKKLKKILAEEDEHHRKRNKERQLLTTDANICIKSLNLLKKEPCPMLTPSLTTETPVPTHVPKPTRKPETKEKMAPKNALLYGLPNSNSLSYLYFNTSVD